MLASIFRGLDKVLRDVDLVVIEKALGVKEQN
jgi:hypothetical protein